jgi:hypothetical protein
MCDGVTQVCVHTVQKLEDDCSGKRALRSSELLRAQTSKRKLLPETDLMGPVKNLGVHPKFTFPNDIDLLRNFSL